jgi:hypothetical protein
MATAEASTTPSTAVARPAAAAVGAGATEAVAMVDTVGEGVSRVWVWPVVGDTVVAGVRQVASRWFAMAVGSAAQAAEQLSSLAAMSSGQMERSATAASTSRLLLKASNGANSSASHPLKHEKSSIAHSGQSSLNALGDRVGEAVVGDTVGDTVVGEVVGDTVVGDKVAVLGPHTQPAWSAGHALPWYQVQQPCVVPRSSQ